jgi:hypothetical protein
MLNMNEADLETTGSIHKSRQQDGWCVENQEEI